MLFLAMNVKETKALILRRLNELQDIHSGAVGNPEESLAAAPEPSPRKRGKNGRRWHRPRASVAPDLDHRLIELEHRVGAIERCFIEGSTESQKREALAVLQQVRGSVDPTATRPGEGDSGPQTQSDSVLGDLPYQLTGTAADGLMTDVLQVLASNRKSGCFSLMVNDPTGQFDVFFREGRICHARSGEIEGEAAFFSMMVAGHRRGRYGFLPEENPAESPTTISANTEFLILEALRRIDEEENADPTPKTTND